MKARIPKHREFIIKLDEKEEPRHEECWQKLMQIMEDYKAKGKTTFSPEFIEDNEQKVKDLQSEYKFTYTIEEK